MPHKTMSGNTYRILAVDIRADRIGYAVFDAPDHLLDYGTSRFRSEKAGKARMESLVTAFDPSVLVLRRLRTRSTLRRHRGNRNRRVIEREVNACGVPVAFVAERAQKVFFAACNCRNKFQVAALLGAWFPEIAPHVPRARKCYEPEPWTMARFDAIALGVAYIMRSAGEQQPLDRGDGTFSSASR